MNDLISIVAAGIEPESGRFRTSVLERLETALYTMDDVSRMGVMKELVRFAAWLEVREQMPLAAEQLLDTLEEPLRLSRSQASMWRPPTLVSRPPAVARTCERPTVLSGPLTAFRLSGIEI